MDPKLAMDLADATHPWAYLLLNTLWVVCGGLFILAFVRGLTSKPEVSHSELERLRTLERLIKRENARGRP